MREKESGPIGYIGAVSLRTDITLVYVGICIGRSRIKIGMDGRISGTCLELFAAKFYQGENI